MPGQPPRRAFSVEEWEQLVDLYDRHRNCEDYDSDECAAAEQTYHRLLRTYWAAMFRDGAMSLNDFTNGINQRCRRQITKG